MAMNFFEHQEQARKHTGRLVLIFIAGVAALIGSTYFVGVLIAMFSGGAKLSGDPLVHVGLFAASALVSLLIVGIGWLVKRAQLAAGGRAVAESLGGRIIEPSTRDPGERRVINIVEEMAIASGVPVPPVYLIPDRSINAFAAGYRPEQAVIGVTRGAVDAFTRDEMQGVIAHEYSHILNGDMRLNIRLVAAIFGLAALSIVGGTLMRVMMHSTRGARVASSRNSKGGGGAILLALLVAGAGLMIIGWIGQLFGRLMQAAVSRQREFLADASAVQFTRNPAGIADALRRIATAGPNGMDHNGVSEVSHMFFTSALEAAFATHPPLAERIARIERRPVDEIASELQSGRFVAARPVGAAARDGTSGLAGEGASEAPSAAQLAGSAQAAAASAASRLVGELAGSTRSREVVARATESIGHIDPESIDFARAIRARLPAGILAAAHEPFDARAVVAALLLSRDPSLRARQIEALRRPGCEGVPELTMRFAEAVDHIPRDLRLPLVDLCVPSIRQLSPAQARAMLEAVRDLIAVDQQLDLFEWAVRAVLRRAFDPQGRPDGGELRLALALPAFAQLLATLAWSGARGPDHANAAFMAGFIAAGVPAPPLPPRTACTLDALDVAVKQLARLRAIDRDRVASAAADCVASDATVTVSEAEILRAVIAMLGAPMPPILPTTTA